MAGYIWGVTLTCMDDPENHSDDLDILPMIWLKAQMQVVAADLRAAWTDRRTPWMIQTPARMIRLHPSRFCHEGAHYPDDPEQVLNDPGLSPDDPEHVQMIRVKSVPNDAS